MPSISQNGHHAQAHTHSAARAQVEDSRNGPQVLAGAPIRPEDLAKRHGLKPQHANGKTEWHGKHPGGFGAQRDGFILNEDGTAWDRSQDQHYTSLEVAGLFGLEPGQYEPVAQWRAHNPLDNPFNGHKRASISARPSARPAPRPKAQAAPSSKPKPPKDEKPVRAKYFDYPDEDGALLFQAIRREFSNGAKTFSQRRPDGNGGWIYDLTGTRRVLYKLPQVLAASTVYMVEGEGCADALNAALEAEGLLGEHFATSAPLGAGNYSPECSPVLTGKRVVFLPDNDGPGTRHVAKACPSIAEHAASLQVLELPGLAEHGDVKDFLESGGTVGQVLEMAENAPDWSSPRPVEDEAALPFEFSFTTDSDLDERLGEIEWLWPGFIPRGFLTAVVGDQDQGKSQVAQSLCDIILRGSRWPDGQPHTPEPDTKLLWIDTEGSIALFHQRAKAWGMPRGRFILPADPLQELTVDDVEHWMWIEAAIERFRPPLVVIDALSGAHKSGKENGNDEMKPVMRKLAALAQRFNIAVVIVHHLNKPAQGLASYPVTIHRLRGATAIPQYCRAILALGTPDMSQPESRRLDVIKLNLARKPESVGYRLSDLGPMWGEAPEAPKQRRAIDDALDFLEVAMKDGPRLASEVQEDARAQKIGSNALRDAMKVASVRAQREGGSNGRWFWYPANYTRVEGDFEEGGVE